MPRRTDLKKILLIGSGPIVIGQACEFDYSGTQACKALREEGYEVVLVNSNPATIMTDPDFADATYIEPLTPEVVASIIEREKPDAVLPTMGGQTALNIAMTLFERGLVGVPGTPELIGANAEAIRTAEDRELFKQAMQGIGLQVPPSGVAHSMDEAREVITRIGLPVVIRPDRRAPRWPRRPRGPIGARSSTSPAAKTSSAAPNTLHDSEASPAAGASTAMPSVAHATRTIPRILGMGRPRKFSA